MTEDKFEGFLKKAAEGYNRPPIHVPRDEMWNAIQAQRKAGPRVVYGGGARTSSVGATRFGSKIWLGAAAAALLLVASGVGIGRWSMTGADRNQVATTAPARAANPIEQSDPATAGVSGPEDANVGPDRSGNTSQSGLAQSDPRSTNRGRVAPRDPGATNTQVAQVARANDSRVPQPAGNSSPIAQPAPGSAYQLAAVKHLTEAEALLASFRTGSPGDAKMDAQLSSWARNLLSNTRLLLDSPVANDPQRRPLLQDLELVLVQIVQLSSGSTPQDRDLIEKTLQQDHVMTRLRTAIPAGQRGS